MNSEWLKFVIVLRRILEQLARLPRISGGLLLNTRIRNHKF